LTCQSTFATHSVMDKTDRKSIIIDGALQVFSNKGYASTRMADIAKEAEMSYGLVYHYFENKENSLRQSWKTGGAASTKSWKC